MDVSFDQNARKIHNPQTRIFSPTQSGAPAPVLEDASMPVRPQPSKEATVSKRVRTVVRGSECALYPITPKPDAKKRASAPDARAFRGFRARDMGHEAWSMEHGGWRHRAGGLSAWGHGARVHRAWGQVALSMGPAASGRLLVITGPEARNL